jgi:mycothiol synthase
VTEHRWSALAEADLEAVVAMLNTVEEHGRYDETTSVDRLRHEMATDLDDPSADSVVAWDGEAAVGLGWASNNRGGRTKYRVPVWIAVHPEHIDAVGPELMVRLDRRAAEILGNCDDALPRVIRGWAYDDDAPLRRLYADAGYEIVRYFTVMRRPLDRPIPEHHSPRGLEIRVLRLEDLEPVRLVHNEAFADHWGSEPQTPERWSSWHEGDPDFRADLSFVAWAGTEVAGYTLVGVYPDDFPRLGYSEGWVDTIGVAARWRRRGLARALLATTLAAIRDDGLDRAALAVDTANPTGALGLYEGLGFRTERRSVTFVREV